MELPSQFVDMLAAMPGFEGVADALASTEPEVAVRLNPAKIGDPDAILAGRDIVPWEPLGFYLDRRPAFTFDPALYDGAYYVQDPSSMIVGEAVRRIVALLGDRPLRYLDACAAPGGKTTSAIAALPADSFVLANEYDPARAAALVENLERWGLPRYAVSRGDARNLAKIGPLFDIVATDVPCSGEGMMRKNETAVTQWSPALIDSCATLQRDIVAAVWSTLRPGGYLIYSTCTFNTTENEDNAAWIRDSLGAQPVDLGLSSFDGVLPAVKGDIPAARFVPGRVRGEGQFVAVFRKPEGDTSAPRLSAPRKTVTLPDWLSGRYIGIPDRDGNIYAVATDLAPIINHLTASKLNLIVPGVQSAVPKGRDMVPAHPLATSPALRADAFPHVDVDYATAIAYLRGEALRLDSDTPRGIVLITHNNHPLGFAKNIGTRANTLLPANRRIRSTHTPDTPPTVL